MTATDELRRMLDERGVEWEPSVFDPQHETFYSTENGVGFIVTEFPEIGRMSLACDMRITPAQAIAATLGRGECHDKNGFDPELGFECTVCGAMVDTYMITPMEMGHVRQFVYCPFCGRRVKVVDE